jgi:ketosteroid isomerase-like protein
MSTLKISMAAVFVVTVLFGCAPTVDVGQELTALMEVDREFSKASVEKGIGEACKMYVAEDAIVFPVGREPISGLEDIYADMKQQQHEKVMEWEPQGGKVAKSGDMGWTWGRYTLYWMDESGEVKSLDGKYVEVWEKQADGWWKVVADIAN